MKFTKMHGTGNDYVYVNGFEENVADLTATAIAVSNRNFGIGSDGLILIDRSDIADVRMRMFNADGGEAEMCGNGVRCVAKFAFDHGLTKNNPLTVQTGRGVSSIALDIVANKVSRATVDMNEPILDLSAIPVDASKVKKVGDYEYKLPDSIAAPPGTFVSMGNPHVTFFVDDVAAVELERIGPQIERSPAFPRRINVHFVQVHSRSEVTMRTWERGSGITLACGTGACAVAVSGVLTGRTDRTVLAHLPGGDLSLEWRDAGNHVFMKGPATEVFSGEWFSPQPA